MPQEIVINGVTLRYVGQPLDAVGYDGEFWAGRSNFELANELPCLHLNDLDDCFRWMAQWKTYDDYQCGYVMDYASRTIYYDKDKALQHLKEKIIPKRKLDGHFHTFVQREF